MNGYKVRLDDGSEIGPLDFASLRSWYSDGLINADSLVLAPGERRWRKLSEAADIKSWGGVNLVSGGRKRKAQAEKWVSAGEPSGPREPLVERLRAPLAGIALITAAALAGFWVWFPAQQRAALHGWPWPQIGLGLLGLGLALFVRPHITRALVFVVLLIGATAALAMVGMLVVQKAPMTSYFVLGGGIALCVGLAAMLEGRTASWLRTIVGVLLVAAAFAGAIRGGYVSRNETESLVYSWVLPARELSDTRLGMRLRLPEAWHLVKPDAPFVAAPSDAVARVALADGTAFGYLTAEQVPAGVVQLDALCERAVAVRRVIVPSLRALERGSMELGKTPASRAVGESGDFSSPVNEIVMVWRDGFTLYTLVGWGQGTRRAEMARRFEALAARFESLGGSGARVSEAVSRAVEQVPFLSPAMTERLMSASDAGVLEPAELFKRALVLAGQGVPRLPAAEMRELQGILDTTYRSMERQDRKRLADYLTLVRGGGTSDAAQDQAMCALMARAVLQLPPTARQRLQVLYDQTIQAAWADSTR